VSGLVAQPWTMADRSGVSFRAARIKPAARAAGLPAGLRVQDLRHTGASLLILEGASIKAVRHHLGHQSASITLDRYGHLFREELDHLADRLDRLHAQTGVYPACIDSSVAALGQGKGPGR
jgi:integrase